jgi:hypothetical protein
MYVFVYLLPRLVDKALDGVQVVRHIRLRRGRVRGE